MIRKIEEKDIPVILDWYNWYISNSIATFETEEISLEGFKQRVAFVTEKYPWVILEENDKIYEIIVGMPQPPQQPLSYSEKELFFGPFLGVEKNPIFIKKWQREQKNRLRVLDQLQQAENPPREKIAAMRQQLAWIEEVLP